MPYEKRKKVLARTLRGIHAKRRLLLKPEGDYRQAIFSHLFDKLGYPPDKRQEVREVFSHHERLFDVKAQLQLGVPPSRKVHRYILWRLSQDLLAIDEKKHAKMLREHFGSNLGNVQGLRAMASEIPAMDIPLDKSLLNVALDVHDFHLISIMGKQDFEWFQKNFERAINSLIRKYRT